MNNIFDHVNDIKIYANRSFLNSFCENVYWINQL